MRLLCRTKSECKKCKLQQPFHSHARCGNLFECEKKIKNNVKCKPFTEITTLCENKKCALHFGGVQVVYYNGTGTSLISRKWQRTFMQSQLKCRFHSRAPAKGDKLSQ